MSQQGAMSLKPLRSLLYGLFLGCLALVLLVPGRAQAADGGRMYTGTAEADMTSLSAPGGVLLFKSGFEDDVRVRERFITGTDLSAPSGINNWDRLGNGTYLPWVTGANAFLEGGSLEIALDPKDPANKVLHFHNTKPDSIYPQSRTQWLLKQVDGWSDNGLPNLFEKQFYRYRMFIPTDVEKAVSVDEDAPWYGMWESHAWEQERTRHVIRLFKKAGHPWRFQVVQEHPEGKQVWEDADHQAAPVPFGEWFTLEVFFKYHETDGEFFVAVTREGKARETVGHFVGKTKYGTKLRDQMIFKMYHSAAWLDLVPGGTHQYYDNFEIWSDFPPGYFSADR